MGHCLLKLLIKKMSQFRDNLKYNLIHNYRWFKQKLQLGKCGKKVWIDKDVKLMRNPKRIFLNNNVVLKEGTRICSCNESAKISIGENTTIGYHTFIFASEKIEIGANCLIAPFVYIVDSNHQIEKSKLINEQPNLTAPIIIGNDVWIASNVTILKGAIIGDGAVIAANSVVNSNVPPYTIFGGSPAKKIGERS
jgi:acetyltransferase-like isoleucine patch superfamily enzyme